MLIFQRLKPFCAVRRADRKSQVPPRIAGVVLVVRMIMMVGNDSNDLLGHEMLQGGDSKYQFEVEVTTLDLL